MSNPRNQINVYQNQLQTNEIQTNVTEIKLNSMKLQSKINETIQEHHKTPQYYQRNYTGMSMKFSNSLNECQC